MAEDFPESCPFSTADDQDMPRILMSQKSGMHKRFVIYALIDRGRLNLLI
jgi:hypothetical protein